MKSLSCPYETFCQHDHTVGKSLATQSKYNVQLQRVSVGRFKLLVHRGQSLTNLQTALISKEMQQCINKYNPNTNVGFKYFKCFKGNQIYSICLLGNQDQVQKKIIIWRYYHCLINQCMKQLHLQ